MGMIARSSIALAGHCSGARTQIDVGTRIDLDAAEHAPAIEIAETESADAQTEGVFGGIDFVVKPAMVFSEKEAIYKAINPPSEKNLDFHSSEAVLSSHRDSPSVCLV